jgi:hypothetical protein
MSRGDERRALDRWARSEGYHDLDTFIRAGGSMMEALQRVERELQRLQQVRALLSRWVAGVAPAHDADEPLPPASSAGVIAPGGPSPGFSPPSPGDPVPEISQKTETPSQPAVEGEDNP